jgi:hypothetical protein
MCQDVKYYDDQFTRVKTRLYNKSKHSSFGNNAALADWYVGKLKSQNCKCYYCETSIHDISELIKKGILKTRSVRSGGQRGPNLEIDKNDSKYLPANCVLACYYCNNDKSYITDMLDYKIGFGENRGRYFEALIQKYIY